MISDPYRDTGLLDLIARHAEPWDLCERTGAEAARIRTPNGLRAKARWVVADTRKDGVGDDAALTFAREVAAFGEVAT